MLEVGALIPTTPPKWHADMLASLHERILAHRPNYPDSRFQELAATLTPGSPTFQHLEFNSAVHGFAQHRGYDAVSFAHGSEFGILKPHIAAWFKFLGNINVARRLFAQCGQRKPGA